MRKLLLLGTLGVIVAMAFAVPALAHGPGDSEGTDDSQSAWQAMYEACVAGDWDAMWGAAEDVHGAYTGPMPCLGYFGADEGDDTGSWHGSDGHMGGMMHGSGGGMMGWW